jgi:MYXO-CTERM domain-containing protein
MKIFKKTLIAATLLLSITSAQAAFVESDWKNPGDALATLDTETGIEWLDLTQTDYMSINQAEGLTSVGGTFEGWRLPTRTEVTQLMVNAFPSQGSQMEGSGGSGMIFDAVADDEADVFRGFFGTTYQSSFDFTRGLLKNELWGEYSVLYSGVADNPDNDYVNISSNNDFRNDYNFKSQAYGVYLVSDGGTTISSIDDPSMNANNANAPVDNVSSPALLGLMGLGLFGFAARRRNAK